MWEDVHIIYMNGETGEKEQLDDKMPVQTWVTRPRYKILKSCGIAQLPLKLQCSLYLLRANKYKQVFECQHNK